MNILRYCVNGILVGIFLMLPAFFFVFLIFLLEKGRRKEIKRTFLNLANGESWIWE